jgi:hypothetical protein
LSTEQEQTKSWIDSLIEKLRQGWVQNNSALDACGDVVKPTDPNAVCWCLTGAAQAVMPDEATRFRLYQKMFPFTNNPIPVAFAFNDTPGRTVDEVIALVEKCR